MSRPPRRRPSGVEPDSDARAADQWERLRSWIQRKIEQMAAGDFERLPPQFADDAGRRACEAYATVLTAMEVIEGRRRRGKETPRADAGDGT